ncbi:type IV pilin protein [Pseudomonas mucidolens]|uniref:Type IV pilus assembly protein PilE n=1 Tax=Pseudomonas mucidolens TaxID=46679 RepID=A0A1H2LM09_9PSED|nr:type IV pilin protein [Pseudomonas mucidolens]SDU81688.1 type IV pilus assembly protein PilE [Pseudomonas mucidolens]SQH36151.1 putative type IV pilus-like protein [Pseudomonas mucidolens]
MNSIRNGFSLIELLIALAIITILSGVAYPGYIAHMKKVYRTEIVGLLTEQAQRLERHYLRNGSFIDATGVSAGNDRYRITVMLNAQDFSLIATPLSSAMAGDRCGDFSLSSSGARTNPGAEPGVTRQECWGR